MDPTSAEMAIEAIEIAECNLLLSIKGIAPDQVYSQIMPEVNSIGWIFGHCAVHLHMVVNLAYQDKRVYSEEVCNYFRYGTSKDEILASSPPISFRDLVDNYLEISRFTLEYLRKLEEEVIHSDFVLQPQETLLQMLYRVILHYMGHMGQIVLIRRALGNPGYSFVVGVAKATRDEVMTEWKKWWQQDRESFNI